MVTRNAHSSSRNGPLLAARMWRGRHSVARVGATMSRRSSVRPHAAYGTDASYMEMAWMHGERRQLLPVQQFADLDWALERCVIAVGGA
jgi:1,4-alpha-glucan branching enzyme